MILSGPGAEGQRVAETGHAAQGLERRGLLAYGWLGAAGPCALLLEGPRETGPARGCPFLSTSGRQAPEPGESGPLRDFKAGAPQPDPLAEGAGESGREVDFGGLPFHPEAPPGPDLQEAPQVAAGLRWAELSGKAEAGGWATKQRLCCVTSGQSLPFSGSWPPSSLPRKLGSGPSWEGGLIGRGVREILGMWTLEI